MAAVFRSELFGMTAKKTSPLSNTSYAMSAEFSSAEAEHFYLILLTILFGRSIYELG